MTTPFSCKRSIVFPICIALCLLCISNSASGQVTYTRADTMIDSAVHHYNAYRDFIDGLEVGQITEPEINYVVTKAREISAEFDAVIRISTGQQNDVAQYFRTMTIYEHGFVLGMAARLHDSYVVMQRIAGDMDKLTEASFPKRYLFEGRNYVINWENFASTKLEFYAGMAELALAEKSYSETLSYARKAESVQYSTNDLQSQYWYKYIANSKYINAAKNMTAFEDDAMEVGIRFIQYYGKLDDEYKKTVADNNFLTHRSGYNYLIQVAGARPELASGESWARAGLAIMYCDDNINAADCFNRALDGGFTEAGFLHAVYTVARSTNNNALGLKACAAEEKTIMRGECSKWRTMADNWRSFGNTDKASDAENNLRACEAEAAYQQELQEKEERKRDRRMNRNFSMYAGIYPIPLLTTDNDYRDYGGVAGFGFRNFSMEASYKKINRNLVVFDDLFWQEIDNPEERVLWDGYRAHVALKFGERGSYSDNFFWGPLLEVVHKEMTTVESTILDATTLNYIDDDTFHPLETSYNGYLNFGMRLEENHFMFEYFMGVGASFSQFDIGNDLYANDIHQFSNTMLEFRKAERWGPIVRFGITIGLSSMD